jgi:hypothetical protein
LCQPQKEASKEASEQQSMNGSLTLNARFTLEGDRLVLRYEVLNRDARDAYLLNRLYRSSPQWEMTPDVIYTHLDPNTGTIWLNKKLADLPPGARITAPVAPYVTPVRAGQAFREEVRIPLPVREYTQYGPSAPLPEGAQEQVYRFQQVYFTVGYYWRLEGTKEEVKAVQGSEVIVPRVPPGTGLQFGELVTNRVALEIPAVMLPTR